VKSTLEKVLSGDSPGGGVKSTLEKVLSGDPQVVA